MGNGGLHSEPQRSSSVSPSQVFITGLILVSSAVQVSTVKCNSREVSVTYQHCGIHPDGVHDLDCFGKYSSVAKKKTCVWKPGKQTSDNRYTLVIQQQRNSRTDCTAHSNITTFSHEIKLFEKYNVTALVFENSESSNCTKAVFRAASGNLYRCGPPTVESCSRRSGKVLVNVSWPQGDRKVVQDYQVRYKELDSEPWREPPVECRKGENCTVENLNASQVYSVQIRCKTNEKCSQCVWSEVYTVPSELTEPPVFVDLQDVARSEGSRLVTLAWKLPAEEQHDGFSVTVGKASGESPLEKIPTTQSTISLILSHSAYRVHVSAVNNASASPALSGIILRRPDEPGLRAPELNVTANSNSSFTVQWEGNHTRNYVCFSVEWMKKGQKTAYKSFHEDKNNYRTLSSLSEPLEPYERYSITLHMRPNKDTCNMKRVNNSEITYGSTQFYLREGTPVTPPANISSSNVTLRSVTLQWSSIQEEDARGFLLGYTIHYTEYQNRGRGNETSVRVDPASNSYELEDLKSGTAYEVQISGFTRAGSGVRSAAVLFKTKTQAYSLSVILTAFACGAAVLIFTSPIIKRVKAILWPSIPNPGNSNAMQKIDWPCELELLESVKTLMVEEWDTNSLQIVEKEAVMPPSTHASTSTLPLLSASEDEGDSDDDVGDVSEHTPAQSVHRTELQAPLAFTSGYTTMEMWQAAAPRSETSPKEKEKAGLAYVRQFSTSPILDKKDMSIII
ncbi:uncharacterized protein V6R79_007627 [Siganus canaliculatus]